MTILEACVRVLDSASEPLTVESIRQRIEKEGLYSFRAKDPTGVVRSALRRHLRADGPHTVVQVSPGTFRRA